MRSFCRKSGVIIQQDTLLDNLGLTRTKLLKVDTHLVFQYQLKDLLYMATHKPIDKLTTDQRHLLAVAIIDKCVPVKILRPIDKSLLPSDVLLQIFPMLLEAAIRCASSWENWKIVKAGLPRMEVRLDNFTELNLVSYLKNIFYVETAQLLFAESAGSLKARRAESLDADIKFERELKAQIKSHNQASKHSKFTPNIGKFVLNVLTKELRNTPTPITPEFRELANYIFSTPADKLAKFKDSYISSNHVTKLRNLIVTFSQFTIAPEDTITRAYTAITVKHLDSKLDYFNSIAAIFGVETEEVLVKLKPEYPVDYTVKQLPTIVKDTSKVITLPPKNPEVAKSTSKFIQQILAKRAAQSGVTNND